jgi:hypothetical protein
MIIDFFKAKEEKEKQKPQGYLGFLKRKAEHERLEKLVEDINGIVSTGSKELLRINSECIKNLKYFWLLIGFIEIMLFIPLLKVSNDPAMFWVLVGGMILFLAGAIAMPIFLNHERKEIIEHSKPIVLPKTEYPPYYSKH